jgi:hypothetical protein
MENTLTQEEAFLAWLNSFKIGKEELKDITSLKDGVFLMKFLKDLDPNFFSLEGFSLEANHWSLCISNIQKLKDSIMQYTKNYLTIQFPEDYINVLAIARQEDKSQILKLVLLFIDC